MYRYVYMIFMYMFIISILIKTSILIFVSIFSVNIILNIRSNTKFNLIWGRGDGIGSSCTLDSTFSLIPS